MKTEFIQIYSNSTTDDHANHQSNYTQRINSVKTTIVQLTIIIDNTKEHEDCQKHFWRACPEYTNQLPFTSIV